MRLKGSLIGKINADLEEKEFGNITQLFQLTKDNKDFLQVESVLTKKC